MANRKVELWNDGTKEYVEDFKGDTIRIPAKSFIPMDDSDASQFMGQFTVPKKDGKGNALSSKPLRKVYLDPAVAPQEKQSPVCMLCKTTCKDDADLYEHIGKEHSHAMLDKEEKKKAERKRASSFT